MAVNLPVQNYFRRTNGPSSWVRPVDWPIITDAANEVQFLMSDLGDSNCSITTGFTRTSGSQNITIDWGDSTTSVISTTTAVTTNHTYTPGTGTPCSLGYTTFKIRVYFTGTGVSVLTQCQIQALLISGNTFSSQNCAVLETYFGNGTVNTTAPSFFSLAGTSTSYSTFNNLIYVKLPDTVTWTSQMNNMFNGCTELTVVIMPTSAANLTSFSATFASCYSLLDITIPSNAISINNFQNTFQTCYNLRSVTFPTTLNSCTTFVNCFNGCQSLKNITIPSINLCNSFSSTFNNCTQLEWIKFNSMPTVASVSFNTTFNGCYNLQNVYFPATGTATSTYDFTTTFNACAQLKSIVLPSNINVNNFSQTFQTCYSLVSCILPTATPACPLFNSTFNGCYSLLKITLPTTAAAAGVSLASTFQNCYKLQEVTIPTSYNITNLSFTFSNCVSLKTLNWTPGAQNLLTTMASAFNSCFLLSSVLLPTSMTTLNSLAGTFATCRTLTTVVFPSTLNAVTTVASLFSGCNLLTSVTLPTSMSACTIFNTMFSTCRSITSVTLPITVSASTTTFAAAFNDCGALKTVVFPTPTQLSLVTSIDTIFNGCSNLTTITNFNRIGSLLATPLMSAANLYYNRFTSISFAGPMSLLQLNGATISTGRTDVQSVRLLNASAGQWTGASPQINVQNTNMSTANLIQLFNDMAAQGTVTAKTINITGATGAAGLTAANRLIITSLGWTITG